MSFPLNPSANVIGKDVAEAFDFGFAPPESNPAEANQVPAPNPSANALAQNVVGSFDFEFLPQQGEPAGANQVPAQTKEPSIHAYSMHLHHAQPSAGKPGQVKLAPVRRRRFETGAHKLDKLSTITEEEPKEAGSVEVNQVPVQPRDSSDYLSAEHMYHNILADIVKKPPEGNPAGANQVPAQHSFVNAEDVAGASDFEFAPQQSNPVEMSQTPVQPKGSLGYLSAVHLYHNKYHNMLADIAKKPPQAPSEEASQDPAQQKNSLDDLHTERMYHNVLSDIAKEPISSQKAAAKDSGTPPKTPGRFVVPSRKFTDRSAQPLGLNSNRPHITGEIARIPGRQPIAAAAYGTAMPGSTNPAIQQIGFGVLAGQRGLHAAGLAFNAAASHDKKQRYAKHLDSFLQDDVKKFNESVASGKRVDAVNEALLGQNPPLPKSKAYPAQDTLILTKDSKGKFQYDIEKVWKQAKSKEPTVAEASLHAKDILLADHIANQIAVKQRDRSLYDLAHSAAAVVGSAMIAGASHGASVAAESSLRTAGYTVTGVSSIDPSRLLRGYKRGAREMKDNKIKSADLINRYDFAQGSKDGFTDPEVHIRNEANEIIGTLPARTVPADEMPAKAVNAAHEALRRQAVQSVEKKHIFGKIFPSRFVNEDKTELAKKQRREEIAEHAYNSIKSYMGVGDPDRIPGIVSTLRQIQAAKPKDQDKVVEKLIKDNPEIGMAYQLVRDFGTGKNEAIGLIVRTMEIAVERDMQGNKFTAPLAGNRDLSKIEKDEIIKAMSDAGKRR